MDAFHSINLIVSKPNVRGGRPCIAETGIRVADVAIVMLFHEPTPGGIAEWFGVSLAEVHAALAYYYLNRGIIDEDIRQQIALGKELNEKHQASG